jgi:hypothetical protein
MISNNRKVTWIDEQHQSSTTLNSAHHVSTDGVKYDDERRISTEPLLYEAVSYAWGIEVSDSGCIFHMSRRAPQLLKVRSNVVEMLRYLRKPTVKQCL